MEPGGENLDLDEDDIYNKLPSEYKPYFRTELTENGNRAEREYSTIGQRKRCENGGFGSTTHVHHYEVTSAPKWMAFLHTDASDIF